MGVLMVQGAEDPEGQARLAAPLPRSLRVDLQGFRDQREHLPTRLLRLLGVKISDNVLSVADEVIE